VKLQRDDLWERIASPEMVTEQESDLMPAGQTSEEALPDVADRHTMVLS